MAKTIDTTNPNNSGLNEMLGLGTQMQVNAAPGSLYDWNAPGYSTEHDQAETAKNEQSAVIDKKAGQEGMNQSNQANTGQTRLAQALMDQAQGKGMSAADLQLQRGADSSLANQVAMARSARGSQMGTANYNAMQQGAKTMANTNQQLGIQRAQESAQAQQALGQVYNQQRAADLQEAGMSMDQAYKQAALEQQQHSLNAQTALGYEGLGFQSAQGQLQGGIAQGQNYLGAQGLNVEQGMANAGQSASVVGGAASAAGAMMAMSDINAKTSIQPAGGAPAYPNTQVQTYGNNSQQQPTQPASQQNTHMFGTMNSQASQQGTAFQPTGFNGGSAPVSPVQASRAAQITRQPMLRSAPANAVTNGPPPPQPQQQGGMPQAAAGAAMAGAMMSDPRTKTDVIPAGGNESDAVEQVARGNERLRKQEAQEPFRSSTNKDPLIAGGSDLGAGLATMLGKSRGTSGGESPDSLNPTNSPTGEFYDDPATAENGKFTSDKRLKDLVIPGGRDTVSDSFLDALSRSEASYNYKDPSLEPTNMPTGGRYLGVMAQSVQKIPEIGHQLVKQGPRGLMLDMGPSLSAALAGLGRLNERLEAVEETLPKKSKGKRK